MLVSSTSMKAAMETTTAISQGLTSGRHCWAVETEEDSIRGSCRPSSILLIDVEDKILSSIDHQRPISQLLYIAYMIKIAILDDYQNVALRMADWSALTQRAEITVFNDHVAGANDVVSRLLPFDVVCVMRERTPLPREVLQRLPRLKLIASTGSRNASIDMEAARELGVTVNATGYKPSPTIELTWALILASLRGIVHENNSIRNRGWHKSLGQDLSGKSLGV